MPVDGVDGTLSVASDTLVRVQVDPVTDVIAVRAGAQTGTTTLHLSDSGGDRFDLPVRVALDAGVAPARLALTVTGQPVQWPWLWSQVQNAIAQRSSLQPGASETVAQPATTPVPPLPNAQLTFDVPVAIGGNAADYDVSTTARVRVDNEAVEPFAPPTLFYDDDPERVDADGVIYRTSVSAANPARLYYYHDDGGPPRRLVVALQSTGVPALVQVIDSSAGPNIDVLSVGHAVSKGMLEMKPRNEGEVVSVGITQPLVLHDVLMTAKQCVAGSVDIQVLAGGPLEVTVLSLAQREDVAGALDGPLLPRDGHHRTGAFSIDDFGTTSLAYSVGGPDAITQYGGRNQAPPNRVPGGRGTDYGDYGVLQTLLFSLANPTAQNATVYLYERPLGGVVRSSFLVDGVLHQVGCVRDSSERYGIAAFELAPGSRYQLQVDTMTDGSSSYPLEVGLTATPPLPGAPPISAPDGCFPKRSPN